MKVNLVIFISSVKGKNTGELVMKTVESTIRPVQGDILDDPGFHPGFHNRYEVVKVTINYALNECWVSLSPLELEREEIKIEAYLERLKTNGWRIVSKKEIINTSTESGFNIN